MPTHLLSWPLNFLMPALAFIGETFSIIARVVSAVLSPVLDVLAITFKIILGVTSTFMGIFKPLVDPIMSFIGFVVYEGNGVPLLNYNGDLIPKAGHIRPQFEVQPILAEYNYILTTTVNNNNI